MSLLHVVHVRCDHADCEAQTDGGRDAYEVRRVARAEGWQTATKAGHDFCPEHRLDRRRNEDGATMIEAAIVMGLFGLLLMALLDGSLLVRTYVSVSNGSTSGARAGSVAAFDDDADYQVLRAVAKQTSAIPVSSIQRVVVFYSTSPGARPPAECLTLSQGDPQLWADWCNVYYASDFARSPNDWVSGSATWAADTNFPAFVRETNRQDPLYVGVLVVADCGCGAGTFGRSTGLLTGVTSVAIEANSY